MKDFLFLFLSFFLSFSGIAETWVIKTAGKWIALWFVCINHDFACLGNTDEEDLTQVAFSLERPTRFGWMTERCSSGMNKKHV